VRPACKADNLTAICEPTILENGGSLQTYGPPWHATGIALPYLYLYTLFSWFYMKMFHDY
jgi:hypothetical protein